MGDQNQTPATPASAPAAAPTATTGVSQTQTAPAVKKDATGASVLNDLYINLSRTKRIAENTAKADPAVESIKVTGIGEYIPHDAKAFAELLKKDVAAKVDAIKSRIRDHGFEAD